MKEIVGNSILIAGLGREGQSILRYVKKNYPYLYIALADKDPHQLVNYPSYKTFSGAEYLQEAREFDTVARSPGILRQVKDLAEVRHITTATNIFFSECPGVVIGITGTKGKSTTSSLINHILESAHKDTRFVGNIGSPALDALDQSDEQTIFVTELSSYQLDDIRYSPHVAVILPIVPEHLDYHGSFEAYIEAKGHIAENQTQSDYVIFYSSNSYTRGIAGKGRGRKLPYAKKDTLPPSIWLDGDSIWVTTNNNITQRLIKTKDIPLQGRANIENVMAASLAGIIINVNLDEIREAIKSFKSLEHRLERIGTFSGITFYNDSLATIPEATAHALEALGEQVSTLIAGGFDRGLDMSDLGRLISGSSVKSLILFPTTGEKIAQAVKEADPQSKIVLIMIKSMEEAVKAAYNVTPKGKICLMSPAAASYNMFKDYADRGNKFKESIRQYNPNTS